MTTVSQRTKAIHEFIISQIKKHPTNITDITAKHFTMSRQAVHKHLKKLTADKLISESGKTRNKIYQLVEIEHLSKSYSIVSNLEEHIIWQNDISPLLTGLNENVVDIWHYGFTEMFNNAIDHSMGNVINVCFIRNAFETMIAISDDGIGIFKKIQEALNLADESHAVLELSKGKLTTDPKHHSGQGIFFSSRMFSTYSINSGKTNFAHWADGPEDFIFDGFDNTKGTLVFMRLENNSSIKMKDVFDEYASPEGDYEFNRTVIPVKLAQYEHDQLISRSQAKRLLSRVDRFHIVVFDFQDIDTIGQAFADEIFRVFILAHPDISISYIHAKEEVVKMISRAQTELKNFKRD